jgi:phosphoribosylanthranilate isomerase
LVARSIIDKLSGTVVKVGVFVNETHKRILEITEMTGLNAIQLHGDEDHKFVHALNDLTDMYLIKAGRTEAELEIANLLEYFVHAILIDGHSENDLYGGSGTRANLEAAKQICDFMPCDVYIAGGLSHENVAEVIRTTRPYAVDVASGVESSPGKKDPRKVEEFIRNAKNA